MKTNWLKTYFESKCLFWHFKKSLVCYENVKTITTKCTVFTSILIITLWNIITLQDWEIVKIVKLLNLCVAFTIFSYACSYLLGGDVNRCPVVGWHAEIVQTLADYNATLRDVIPLDIDLFLLIMSASLKANVSPVLTVTVPYNGWCSKIAQNEPRRVTMATAELYEMEKLSYRCTRSTSTFEKHLVETVTADWTVLQQCSGHCQRMDKVYW